MVSIAFDPGTNWTGYCVFDKQGNVVDIGLLGVPVGLPFETKLLRQKRNVHTLLTNYHSSGSGIAAIAIEDWQGGSWSNDSSMRRCWAIRGMLICLADDFCFDIRHPNKKTIRKAETIMLAQAYGIPTEGKSKAWHNALDAFQIGVCAGFDK